MSAALRKTLAAPRKMLAATHLIFAKDQKWAWDAPQGPRGPPTPIIEILSV